MRSRPIVAVAVAVLALAGTATATVNAGRTTTVVSLRHAIRWHRGMTWRWQDRAGVSRTPTRRTERRTTSVDYLRWIDRLWSRRRITARRRYLATERRRHPIAAHAALWLCIHRGEGAWDDDTGNGYYGGLQMTAGWGGVARPDLLPPAAQMALAERQFAAARYSTAWLVHQWPSTAPPCLGLA
jgi:hypothetical protein